MCSFSISLALDFPCIQSEWLPSGVDSKGNGALHVVHLLLAEQLIAEASFRPSAECSFSRNYLNRKVERGVLEIAFDQSTARWIHPLS